MITLIRVRDMVKNLVQQLEMLHANYTDMGKGCDGTCSYLEAIEEARKLLAEIGE